MIRLFNLIVLFAILSACTKDSVEDSENVIKKESLPAVRIAWDYSSLQKLVPLSGNTIAYSSYARMIELDNGDFICVYEADGNVDMIRSSDKAESWTQPMRIVTFSNNRFMAVPEVIQLTNGDIIISYNPRPGQPFSEDRPFAIHTKISTDNGATWGVENVIYEGGITFETGCWEPNILELPDGELQLYFANETDFTSSHEQNISMFRSSDNGETWGEREIVSFSPTSRDGMPVTVYLEETGETIMAIEDNYANNFKPAIIRTSDNWKNAPVGRNTTDRVYALNHDQRTPTYQGAPYLRKLPSGNIVLGYQGTDGERDHDISNACLLVEVGDKTGRSFHNNTKPFNVPTGKYGLWNSLSVMDGKVWGLTATNAYSNQSEIWTISGYEITGYNIPQGEIVASTNHYPFFVGHKESTNVGVRLGYDDSNLYLKAVVKDEAVFNKDGITFSFDTNNISSEAPSKEIFKILVTADGEIISKEGYNGKWEDANIETKKLNVTKTSDGYEIDMTVAWSSIGGKPATGERIGFSVSLSEYKIESRVSYVEQLIMCEADKPYTWATIRL